MGFQLVLGSSGSGKSTYVLNRVVKESMSNSDCDYIMIVPEQFTLETQRQIVTMHPNNGVFNIDIVSFERLTYRIFEELNYNAKPVLDDCGKTLLLRKVIEDNKEELVVYGKNSTKLGFVEEMKSLISEMLQYSISKEMLHEAYNKTNDKKLLNAKIKDIILIYEKFRESLGEQFMATEELLNYLCQLIPKSNIIKNSTITLDGYTGFTPIQLKVIELLMIYAKDVIVTITIPSEENYRIIKGEQELFNLSKETISKLLGLAEGNRIVCEEDVVINDSKPVRFEREMLGYLEKHLFRYTGEICHKKDGGVCIYEAFNPQKEISYVVYRIKKLIEEGYRFRDIAVVTGDNEKYAQAILKIFEQNNIKGFVDNKKGVMDNPFVQLIRNSLLISKENFSYDSVFALLKTGLLDVDLEDVDILENYVLATGVRGYTSYNKIWVKTGRKEDSELLEHINNIRINFMKDYQGLYDILKKGRVQVKAALTGLYGYICSLDLYNKLKNKSKAFETAGDYVLAKEFESIYELVIDMFDRVVRLIGEEYVTAEELMHILDTGFEQIKIGVIPSVIDSVTIGDIERTRLGDIKALFFVGVNEGIIPKNESGAGILSEFDRERLKNINIKLAPTKKENAYIQKFYLYLNMTKPRQNLYISYSKFDFEGKSSGPSYLINVIKGMYSELTIDKEHNFKDMKEYIYVPKSELSEEFEAVKKLDRQSAGALYGDVLFGSVSRIEKYVACEYAHFLQYGLKLKERKVYEVTAGDLGTLYHEVIRRVTLKIKESEYTFSNIPNEIKEEIVRESVLQVSSNYNNTIMLSSEKNKYMLEKLTQVVNRTIWAIGNQLKSGNFKIDDCEVAFSPEKTSGELELLLSNGGKMQVNGRIDRVDCCEKEEEVIVKVVDYKTYDEKLDYEDIYYGLKLQLLVYMKAALLIEANKNPDKRVVPGAILYNVLKNPIISIDDAMENDKVDKMMLEKMRPEGMVSDSDVIMSELDASRTGKSYSIPVKFKKDGKPDSYSSIMNQDVFDKLPEYAFNKIKELSEKIIDGNVSINPYKKKDKTACDYCEFSDVCGFDIRDRRYNFNIINKMDEDSFIKKMKGENADA